jgi:AbrB family looped-hinge helix DNA binding protein
MPAIRLRKRGQLTLPEEIRSKFRLEEGDSFDVKVRGREIVLIPYKRVPLDQAWFWTKEWQAKEQEADKDLAAGRYKDYDTVDDLLEDLHRED